MTFPMGRRVGGASPSFSKVVRWRAEAISTLSSKGCGFLLHPEPCSHFLPRPALFFPSFC